MFFGLNFLRLMNRSVFLLNWPIFLGSVFCLVFSRRSRMTGTIGQYSWGDPWWSKVVLGHLVWSRDHGNSSCNFSMPAARKRKLYIYIRDDNKWLSGSSGIRNTQSKPQAQSLAPAVATIIAHHRPWWTWSSCREMQLCMPSAAEIPGASQWFQGSNDGLLVCRTCKVGLLAYRTWAVARVCVTK